MTAMTAREKAYAAAEEAFDRVHDMDVPHSVYARACAEAALAAFESRAEPVAARVEMVEMVQLYGCDPNYPAPPMWRCIIGREERCFDFDTEQEARNLALAVSESHSAAPEASAPLIALLSAAQEAINALRHVFEDGGRIEMNPIYAVQNRIDAVVAGELDAAAKIIRRAAMDAQPSTAENPNEDAYQRGRFDGLMEYHKNLLKEVGKPAETK